MNLRIYWKDTRLSHLADRSGVKFVVLNPKLVEKIWIPDIFIGMLIHIFYDCNHTELNAYQIDYLNIFCKVMKCFLIHYKNETFSLECKCNFSIER